MALNVEGLAAGFKQSVGRSADSVEGARQKCW